MNQNQSDVEAEYARLFRQARKSHRRLGKAATTDDSDHIAAVTFAEIQGWVWAGSLLEASRLNGTGANDQVLHLLAEIEASVPARWHGLVHFLRGAALHEKGELDEAIKAYRKALDDPKYDTPGVAWNNIGITLATKGEQDEAVKAYRKALDDPKFDTPGIAWYNIGGALAAKGEQDEAIKAYRKALDDLKCDTSGNAWNNMGVALAAKGEQDEAIKAYRRALEDPKYGTPARAWTNLARAYVDAGKPKQAEEAFKNALASPDKRGGDHARARLGLQLLNANIEPEALSPDDRALVGKPAAGATTEEIEDAIITAIKAAGDTHYDKYLEKPDSTRDDVLSILRGWSSAVTLLEGSSLRAATTHPIDLLKGNCSGIPGSDGEVPSAGRRRVRPRRSRSP